MKLQDSVGIVAAMEYSDADRYLRQLMLCRYKRLIDEVETKFALTKEQVALLYERILNIHWIDIN